MPYEQDIRAAFRVLADQAPNAADVLTAVRDRQAAETSGGRNTKRSAHGKYQSRPGPRLRRWIAVVAVPAAAAVAVVAVIAASVALSGGAHPASRVTNKQSASLRSVPPYYLAPGKLQGFPGGSLAKEGVLHSTFTGKPVATFHLPRPYYYISGFAGAGTGRTFVVTGRNTSTQRYATAFFLARFDPRSQQVTVTALHIPKVFHAVGFSGRTVTAMALSPTATRLAIVTQKISRTGGKWEAHNKLSVYSLPSGRAKVWTIDNGVIGQPYPPDPRVMSWLRSGTLAFTEYSGTDPTRWLIRLLNPSTSGGGSLLEQSRLVVRLPDPSDVSDAILTPDGMRIVAAHDHWRIQTGKKLSVLQNSALYDFSTATGKIISIRDKSRSRTRLGASDLYVYWTNSSGSVLVVGVPGKGLGVLIGNRLTRLHTPFGPPGGVTSWIVF